MNSQLWVCRKKNCIWVREYGKRIFFFHKNQKFKKKNVKNWMICVDHAKSTAALARREKKNRVSYSRTQIPNFFFTNSKLRVYNTRVCRAHKNFQLFIKFWLKISFLQNFFVSFGSLKTTDIFVPSMKFPLNYHR